MGKRELGSGYGLSVKWRPGTSNGLEGEVKGHIVYVYSKDPERAVETLKHEF